MKKRFTILFGAFCALMILISMPGKAVGQNRTDEVYSTCLFGSDYNSTSIGDYTSTWTTTNGSFSWTIVNGNNNQNGWTVVKFGRKNNASVGKITTSVAYSVAVTKVVITIDALTVSKINSIKLYTSSNGSSWTEAGTFDKNTGAQTVTLSSPTASRYYKIEFDCASGSSNGLISVSKVEYYQEAETPAYTITAQSNNTTLGTVSLVGTVITGTPATNCRYASPAYTVSSGTATVSQNGNAFTVTPSSDCTVCINFEAIPTHTATFSVNGATTSTTFAEGASITFPANPANINGKTFVGWVAAAINGIIQEAPSFVTSATMGTADVTYYAVFANVTPGTLQDASNTITPNTENIPASYGSGFNEYTLNGVKFQIQQMYKSGELLQWRAAGHASGTGTMYNTDALQRIQSVVLTYNSSDTNKNFSLKIGNAENPSEETSITPTNSESVYTFDCSSYNYDYFVLTNGSGAGYLDQIVINYKTGTPDTYSNYCTTVTSASTWFVTYNGNGADGGNVPTDNTAYNASNNQVTVLGHGTLSRTGYTFVNWNTESNGSGTSYSNPATPSAEATFTITGNTTLFAQWTANEYAITKSAINGSVAVTETAHTDDDVNVSVAATSGYEFYNIVVSKTDDHNTTTTISGNLTDGFTFKMPGYPVTVTATFTKHYSWNLTIASYDEITDLDIVTWSSDYATMTNSTGTSSTRASNYLGGDGNNRTSSRFYTNNILTITPATNYKIFGIVFTATSESYATALGNSTWTNASASVSSTTVTVTPNDGQEELSATIGGTCGFTSVVVYYVFYIPVNGNDEITANVTIPSGTTYEITSKIEIPSGKTLTVDGQLVNNNANNLVIEDGGQLILKNGNSGVEATVKKNTDAYSKAIKWYAISSPVDDVLVTSFVKGEKHNVYSYITKSCYWNEYRGAHDETLGTDPFENLTNGRGYIYRSQEEGIEFKGDVNVGSITCQDLGYTCSNTKYNGFNLIGNPFTHEINWSNLTTATNISTDGFYTLTTNGEWVTQTIDDGTIAPMQAFMVQATNASPSIIISNTVGGGGGKGDDDRFGGDQIMFNVENSEYSDIAYVLFKKGHGLNKIEHRNDKTPMLYIINEDGDYAIADMPDNTNAINIGFEAKTMGQYKLSLKAEGLYSYMHLIDKLTGDDMDMLIEDGYSFIGSPSDRKDRFVLRLKYNAAGIDTESDIFAYQSGSDILVSGEGELQIFDVMGRLVMLERINGVETINGLNNGVYIFRMEGKTQKIVVR